MKFVDYTLVFAELLSDVFFFSLTMSDELGKRRWAEDLNLIKRVHSGGRPFLMPTVVGFAAVRYYVYV